jgi:hypothetical protein
MYCTESTCLNLLSTTKNYPTLETIHFFGQPVSQSEGGSNGRSVGLSHGSVDKFVVRLFGRLVYIGSQSVIMSINI